MTSVPISDTLATVERSLLTIGYKSSLLQRNYRFADAFASANIVRNARVATFFSQPPSYRTACVGVFVEGEASPNDSRSLGAEIMLEVGEAAIQAWEMTADGPQPFERVEPTAIQRLIEDHADRWGPDAIRNTRTITRSLASRQLDFADLGYIPVIESAVRQKLDELLQDTLAKSERAYEEHIGEEVDQKQLFRLVFRYLAAKLLADRQYPGWTLADDAAEVLTDVERFYFHYSQPEPAVADPETQRVAWNSIRNSFHLQNISLEVLAYVYENTFVTKDLRRHMSIHSTPPEVAEYLVQHLPIDRLAEEERRVFEPFSGHGSLLIAALGRLRVLLQSTTDTPSRHDYLVRMLRGVEQEPFAREIAWLSLVLADFPNPNGWQINAGDVFAPNADGDFSWARIVVANPPFGRFSLEERQRYRVPRAANRAAEALRRVLRTPPAMLGFVLPAPFVSGPQYAGIRRTLIDTYSDVEVIKMPDKVFQYAEQRTVLLMAYGSAHERTSLRAGIVTDYDMFARTGQPQELREGTVERERLGRAPILWLPRLGDVWDNLRGLRTLGDVAFIERGLEYRTEARAHSRSATYQDGFGPGLGKVSDGFEPFVVRGLVYLNPDKALLRRPTSVVWDMPKVIVNRVRLSRTSWLISGIPDRSGLLATENFYILTAKEELPVEVLAAILNGPIANAYLHDWQTSQNIVKDFVQEIPVPHLTPGLIRRITDRVLVYQSIRSQWLHEPKMGWLYAQQCRAVLDEIDADLLRAYDLPPRVERTLLDYFWGHQRPGPVDFKGYYPPEFKPALPWHMFVSGELADATVEKTLERLPVLDDPAIHDILLRRDRTER